MLLENRAQELNTYNAIIKLMFVNREEAGKKLADKLNHLKSKETLVLAIPRGGVVIGKVLSEALDCPLEVVVVKKLGAPGNPELAIGAAGPDGVVTIDWELARLTNADQGYIEGQKRKLKKEIEERQEKFGKVESLKIKDKIAILTDDGIATGATIEAAITWIKMQEPKKIVLAVPVAPPGVAEKFKSLVDLLIILETPAFFGAVGQFYQEFPQVEDEEVIKLLQ